VKRFRILPHVEVLNDEPRIAIIHWLRFHWLYRA
jgi:hypothetical protein